MKMKHLFLTLLIISVPIVNATLFAHCQIPCGIYDDTARIALMREHVSTIEKSMKEINRLAEEDNPNWNQLVRWVQNKEVHADELTEIVTFYFMAQRIKPIKEHNSKEQMKYIQELTLLHEIMVTAMKAKQTTDLDHCTHLKDLIDRFEKSYLTN